MEAFNNYDPDSRCPGGMSFDDCQTAQRLQEVTGEPPTDPEAETDTHIGPRYLNSQKYMPLGCIPCRQICEIAYAMIGGKRTGEVQVIPLDPEEYARLNKFMLEKIGKDLKRSIESKKDRVGG